MASKKIQSTTQAFTEIEDIIDDIVLFKGKNACSIIEVSSVNFYLLSEEEQNARIYGYMSFINSLSFTVQILIISRRIDLTTYIEMLEKRISEMQNPRIAEHLSLYKEFINELIQGGDLLDKKLYIVIPFSYLEMGPIAATGNNKKTDYIDRIKQSLYSKRSSVIAQVQRMGLNSRTLQKDELAKLYYEIFNQDPLNVDFNANDIRNIIL